MGRVVLRLKFALGLSALALVAAPVSAQDNGAAATNNVAADALGPRELQNFDLGGTVTREAEQRPAPAPARPAPATTAPRSEPSATRPAAQASPRPEPTAGQPATTAQPTVEDTAPALPAVVPPVVTTPVAALPPPSLEPSSPTSIWPWLVAGLVAAGAAGFFLYRRRQAEPGYAVAGAEALAFDPAPAPQPVARPRAPLAPPPAPPKAKSTGVISSSLKPDLDFAIRADRAVVDDQGATIEFEVEIRNNGSAPARDVQIEACMVNAGPAQDQELGAFFAHPPAKASAIPQIPPLSQIRMKSAVRLPLEDMRQFEIEGRKLFVPLVGVNALYRGPSGAKQTSASYLVGRDNKGEKLAPLRLDLGPKIFRGLGVRQHTLGLRT